MTDERKVINLAERKLHRAVGTPAPVLEVPIPDFITPQDISTLTDDQLEQLLNLIRMRRMSSYMLHQKTVEEKEHVSQGRAREMLDKKCIQVFNEMEKAFKVLDKLELRINELRALRPQAGLTF